MTLRRRPLLLLLTSLPALGQTQRQRSSPIFRCGPDGRELRDRPCPAGPSASESVRYDQPSEQDRLAAQQRQAADAREAARLQRERERREAEAARALQPAPAPASAPASRPIGRVRRKKIVKDEKTRTVRAPAAKP